MANHISGIPKKSNKNALKSLLRADFDLETLYIYLKGNIEKSIIVLRLLSL